MSDFVLNALDYGVLGLCAVMVVVTARILYLEQKREGQPRAGLLRFVYVFLGFCSFIAILNAYVQIDQRDAANSEEVARLKTEVAIHRERTVLLRSKLNDIETALDDKSYTELASLVASADPVLSEQLTHKIYHLKQRVAEAKSLVP